jgi:transcriptional regulator with XRE-family HTH domain
MTDSAQRITRMIFAGLKNVDIADACGVDVQTVSNIRNSRIVQRQLEIMQAAANKEAVDIEVELRKLTPTAVGVLKDVMEDPGAKHSDKIKAAVEALDRGHRPVRREVDMRHSGRITTQTIEEIKEIAIRKGYMRTAEDTEYEEVNVDGAVDPNSNGDTDNSSA